jgi:hypothetical protein
MKEADRGFYFGEVKVIYDMLCLQASYEPETFHIRSIRVGSLGAMLNVFEDKMVVGRPVLTNDGERYSVS